MTRKYTVTFKVLKSIPQGNQYLSRGYIWYELQAEADKKHPLGMFYEKTEIEKHNTDKEISSLTIELNQQQYEKLLEFGKTPTKFGFLSSSSLFVENSTNFVLSALESIGYDLGNYQSAISNVDNGFETLIDILAQNNAHLIEEQNIVPLIQRKTTILNGYQHDGVYRTPFSSHKYFSDDGSNSNNNSSNTSRYNKPTDSATNPPHSVKPTKPRSPDITKPKSDSPINPGGKIRIPFPSSDSDIPFSGGGTSSNCSLYSLSVYFGFFTMMLRKSTPFALISAMASIKAAVNTFNMKQNPSSEDLGNFAKDISIALLGLLPYPFSLPATAWGILDTINSSKKDGCLDKPKPVTPGDGVPRDNPPEDTPPPACPLIIDMDGNGVKTIARDKNVFFDLDNNLFAENTGWVGQGDAFLVWDRDGNGEIDNGNELFGNHTLLKNGKRAANGFAALAELDDNNDDVFDAKDKLWSALQLWFDYNQNGISESEELIKLSQSGIKQIRLNYHNSNVTDENGNAHRQQSSVIWNDGRESGISDVWFNTNTVLSYYKEQVNISDDISALPNVAAFGKVFTLHTAMAKKPTLKYVVEEYLSSSSQERSSLLNDLIYEWAGTVNVNPTGRGNYIDGRKAATMELLLGLEEGNTILDRNRAEFLATEFDKFARYTLAQLESKAIYHETFAITSFLIDTESGELDFDWEKLNTKIVELTEQKQYTEAKRILSIAQDLGTYNISYLEKVNKNFEQLAADNKMVSLLLNTQMVNNTNTGETLSGTDNNELLVANSVNRHLKGDYGHDVLIGHQGNNLLQGGAGSDTYVFSKGHGQDIIQEEGHWSWMPNDIDTIRFTDVNYADVKFRQVGNDLLLLGYNGDDSITIKDHYSGDKKNQIEKFEFLDRTLTLKEMQEEGMKFVGTEGNDVISQNTKVILDGGAGNDTLTGSSDDDILIGGTGNDMLNGGIGADTYIVSKGHGHDIIQEKGYWMRLNEQDTLQFTDVKYDEVRFRRIRDNLMLHGYNPNDSVTIRNFFADADNQIENFQFSDRTLTVKQMKEEGMTLVGTSGKDEIMAWGDKCTIDSSLGNDVLIGSSGAETYLFRRGHGKDVIQPVDGTSDTIRFVDIHSSKVNFERVGNDLILSGYHKTDSVTVKDFYAKTVNQIGNFVFSDRTLSLAQLKQNGVKIFGTDGNDVINDDAEASIINAGKGDDIINAGDGNDTLIGGEGNDILNGAHGNDTYIFGAGHGKDVIHDENYWMHFNNKDVMRFTDITDPKKLWFSRQGSNLLIQELGTQDSVTVSNWFNGKENQIEEIRLANEKALYAAQVNKMIEAMASFGAQYGGDINLAPKEEVNAYLDKIAVGSYWG